MPVFQWRDVAEERFEAAGTGARGRVVRGRAIEVAWLTLPAGGRIEPQKRSNEHILTLLRGRARFRIGDEERLVGPGQALLIRPGTVFSAQILDEGLETYAFQDVGKAGPPTEPGIAGPSFFTWSEMASDFITPRYSSGQGPTITGERIEVAYMTYPAGTEGKPHVHPNEQIQVPLKGRARYLLEEPQVAGPGEVVLIPADLRHGAQILDDFTVLNAKNIVPGWSVYNAGWEKEKGEVAHDLQK